MSGNHNTQEEVESQYKISVEKYDRERLLAVLMAYEKNTLDHIGFTLRRGRATIARWLKAYREGGINQLLEYKHGGRQASLPSSDRDSLIQKLKLGQWKRARDIQDRLSWERGIQLKVSGVYYWLRWRLVIHS